MIRIENIKNITKKIKAPRYFIDSTWPIGINPETSLVHLWLKELAPSAKLLKWYTQNETEKNQFKHRYFKELGQKQDVWLPLLACEGDIALVHGEGRVNHVHLLREFLLLKKDEEHRHIHSAQRASHLVRLDISPAPSKKISKRKKTRTITKSKV